MQLITILIQRSDAKNHSTNVQPDRLSYVLQTALLSPQKTSLTETSMDAGYTAWAININAGTRGFSLRWMGKLSRIGIGGRVIRFIAFLMPR